MRNSSSLLTARRLPLCLFALLSVCCFATRADAVAISSSAVAPTVNGADIANLGQGTSFTDFQSSFIWPDRPARGQTFVTANTAGDYTLNAITLQSSELASPSSNYTLRIGSVAGNSFTTLQTETGSYGTAIQANDYVTFTLDTPLSLTANTTYGFDVSLTGSTGGFQANGWELRNNAQTEYGPGTAYQSGSNAVGGTTISTFNQDRIFHLDLVEGTLPPPPTPVSILSTDFTGRTVSGNTASNITWTTNGVADPGAITAVGGPGLFDTAAAQGHFAPDRNVDNEGPWSVDIPLTLEASEIVIEEVELDWQNFNNQGAFQSANRPVEWTASLIGSMSGQVASESIDTNGISGIDSIFFAGGVALSDDELWTLQISAVGSGPGNNTGLDAINVFGFINDAVVPEPAALAIWSLLGLAVAVMRKRRRSR